MDRNRKRISVILAVTMIIGCSLGVNAQLQTSRIFTDGMVLQRDLPLPVWGTSKVNDTVIVSLNGMWDTAYADNTGKWEASLPAMSAGGPYIMTVANRTTTHNRANVYIGDVWLAAGQSNMAFTLSQSDGGAAEIAATNNQTIRQLNFQSVLGNEPASDIPSGSSWTAAVSSSAGNFTAVGYYFAKELQKAITVPVGIINASRGGSRIETYMSEEMLGYDETDVTLASGEYERQPTVAFNTMINPITRLPIKGIIWYQAESNGDNMEDAISYGNLFKRMINAYRDLWGYDIPILWVQMPNQGKEAVESEPGAWDVWPRLREEQSRALSMPNTGEATTIDVGAVDIHPTNKAPVGKRLSLVARKVVYGEDIVYSGPRYSGHRLLADGSVKIGYSHIGGGLVAKNTTNDSIHWFSIADHNGTLYPASSVIEGDSVLVMNSQVTSPAKVRYAWEYNPVNVNFYNVEDLPAVPFLINVVNPGFGIDTLATTDTLIERYKSVVLSWKVYGSDSITLNGETVDSVDGIRLWPKDTTQYLLCAVNRNNPSEIDSALVTINVIEPRPTILLKSDLGDLITPGTEIILTATLTIPAGLGIQKVDFFVNDTLLVSDNTAPYETKWTPPGLGEYAINAFVTDSNNAVVESNKLNVLVTNLTVVIYEAENAARTGTGSIQRSAAASGGRYADLQDAWTLTFSGIKVPETKEYQLSIRYLLNYESPKTQNLVINGTPLTSIVFTAPNTSTWMTYRLNVPLVEGDNVIAIQGSWNWMSIDYISLAGEGLEVPEDTTTKPSGLEKTEMNYHPDFMLFQNSPNPFSVSTGIAWAIPESGHVLLEVMDITGRKVAQLVNGTETKGIHESRFEAGNLQEGAYIARLSFGNKALTKRMMVIK